MGTDKRERQKANRVQARIDAKKAADAAKRKRAMLRIGSIVLAAAVAVVLLSVLTKDKKKSTDANATTTSVVDAVTTTTVAAGPTTTAAPLPFTYGTGECPAADGSAKATKTFSVSPKLCIDPAKTYVAKMDTSQGSIAITLDTKRTPGTTNNFVALARYHYYDDTILFRTNTGIDIIQGGGKTNTDSPGYVIPDEGGKFTYTEGDFVMARTAAPNSAGGQFFFSTGPKTAALDGQGTYVTFGKVTDGLDVVKKIMALHKDGPSPGEGAPSETVTIKTITIVES